MYHHQFDPILHTNHNLKDTKLPRFAEEEIIYTADLNIFINYYYYRKNSQYLYFQENKLYSSNPSNILVLLKNLEWTIVRLSIFHVVINLPRLNSQSKIHIYTLSRNRNRTLQKIAEHYSLKQNTQTHTRERERKMAKDMETVKGLDIERYMGRWYEIASFPSRFQPKSGVDTRATYTLNPDGTVHVLNETWTDGKRGYIEGTAYKTDPKSDEAKLKVKFYVPPFLPIIPVTGDYWVLFIDGDYQYAVIGQPSRKYLWVCLDLYLVTELW